MSLTNEVLKRLSRYNPENTGTIVIKQGERKYIKGTVLKNLRIVECVLLNGMTQGHSFHQDSALTQVNNLQHIKATQLVGDGYHIGVCYDQLAGVIEVSGMGVREVIFSFK